MSYYGDEDYDYERPPRRPSPHRYRTETRRSAGFLNPNADGGGLYRARSQGQRPIPVVNVYNEVVQEATQSGSSPPRVPYPPSPDMRGRRGRLSADLADEFMDLAVENRRLRSRSRGRSDAAAQDGRSDFYEWELRQRERELKEIERRAAMDRERARIEQEYEMRRLKDEAKRKADEAAAKEEKKRIIDDYERKQREDEEDRKAEEKRIKEKLEREKREAKEKEEREWADFLRKQKEKEEEEKEKKKKREEEFEDEMRKRLARFGFTPNQIETMVQEEMAKQGKTTTTTTTTAIERWQNPRAPVYAKVHRDYLSIDTLKYYDVPWEYDRVCLHFFSLSCGFGAKLTSVLV